MLMLPLTPPRDLACRCPCRAGLSFEYADRFRLRCAPWFCSLSWLRWALGSCSEAVQVETSALPRLQSRGQGNANGSGRSRRPAPRRHGAVLGSGQVAIVLRFPPQRGQAAARAHVRSRRASGGRAVVGLGDSGRDQPSRASGDRCRWLGWRLIRSAVFGSASGLVTRRLKIIRIKRRSSTHLESKKCLHVESRSKIFRPWDDPGGQKTSQGSA